MVFLSEEEYKARWEACRTGLASLLGVAIKAVVEKYSDEAVKVIAEAWKEANKRAAEIIAKRAGIEERDVRGVAKIIDDMDYNYGVVGEWVELSEKRGVKIERSCPVAKYFPPQMCDLFAAAIQGLGEGLTKKPGFKASLPKCIARGDEVCEIVLELGG